MTRRGSDPFMKCSRCGADGWIMVEDGVWTCMFCEKKVHGGASYE